MSTNKNSTAMRHSILGHGFQRSALESLVSRGKVPTTMMFAGIPGIGKRLVARELARTLLCEQAARAGPGAESSPPTQYGGCGSCHACHVFSAGNHPDLHLLDLSLKEEWGVEEVRALLFSLRLSAFSAGARVILIDNADHASLAIANTLLKILEEPPARTYFMLIASNPSKLPPTVISRCQVWFFDSLRREEIETILGERDRSSGREPRSNQDRALIADGSLDGIDHIELHLGQWKTLTEELNNIADGARSSGALLASRLAKDKEGLPAALKLMRIFARQRMIAVCHEGPSRHDLSARWSLFLTNLLAAEHFLFERNLAPLPVLAVLFDSLAGKGDAALSRFTNSAALLSEVAV